MNYCLQPFRVLNYCINMTMKVFHIEDLLLKSISLILTIDS